MKQDSKGFDWGPPTSSTGEAVKEWGIYFLLVLLIGGGGWLLIDSARQKDLPPTSPVPALSEPSKTVAPTPVAVNNLAASPAASQISPKSDRPKPNPVFLVQLGAFGDEESARTVFHRLKSLGFVANLAAPDEQFEMYRLLMGPFSSENEAEGISRKLNELDFPCFVIESQ